MNEALRKFLIFCLFETNINFSFFRNSKKKLIQENKNMQKLIYNCNAYIVAFLLMFTFFLWLKQQQKKTNISRKVTIYLLQLRSPFYKWGAMEIKMTIKMAVRKQLELCKPYSAIFIFSKHKPESKKGKTSTAVYDFKKNHRIHAKKTKSYVK